MSFRKGHGKHLFQVIKKQFHTPVVAVAYMWNSSSWVSESRRKTVHLSKPVDECPVYTEYFKEGDSVPSRLCNIHRGSLKQRATRAVAGFFRSLGSAIADIFRR